MKGVLADVSVRTAAAVLAAVLFCTPATATHHPDHFELIVPGERIGDALLGMPRQDVEAINRKAACQVAAAYDSAGRAVRLETNTGGACRTQEGIQVGIGFGSAIQAFGASHRVVEDARYPHATAFWISYPHFGITFRVLAMSDSSTLIQAIAVFPVASGQAP